MMNIKLDVTKKDLEGIAREMHLNGFEVKSPHDAVMYWYLGSTLYLSLCESSFRYGCIEAEYLGQKKGTKEWHNTLYAAHEATWKMMYQNFPDLVTRDFSTASIQACTDAEMLESIKKKYTRKNHNASNS
jgi:hypothetical protein